MKRIVLFFVICLIASSAFADTIRLRSGFKVVGKVTEFDHEYVVIVRDDTGDTQRMPLDKLDNDSLAFLKTIPERKKGGAPRPVAEVSLPVIEQAAPATPVNDVPTSDLPVVQQAADIQPNIPVAPVQPDLAVKPSGGAAGQVHGRPFTVEQAKFNTTTNVLELRQGKDFFPELAIDLFLFKPKGSSWENTRVQIAPGTTGSKPHVWKKWRVEGKNVPESKAYMSDYTLDLSLGGIQNGKLQGVIKLQLPDEQASHVQGTFEALLDSPTATVKITKDGQTVTRPISEKEITMLKNYGGSIMGFFVLIYFVACMPFYLISRKLGIGLSILAFIPLLNIFLTLQLAKKPLWWFLLLLIPVVNLFVIVLIYCGIAETCQKPVVAGVFVLIPLVNVLLPWYFFYGLTNSAGSGGPGDLGGTGNPGGTILSTPPLNQ